MRLLLLLRLLLRLWLLMPLILLLLLAPSGILVLCWLVGVGGITSIRIVRLDGRPGQVLAWDVAAEAGPTGIRRRGPRRGAARIVHSRSALAVRCFEELALGLASLKARDRSNSLAGALATAAAAGGVREGGAGGRGGGIFGGGGGGGS